MIFEISRASYYYTEEEKPCEEAIKNKEGNWVVEILSINDLMNFINKYGRCIISTDYIKIYDDYVE